jgi:glutamate carboxypeptidase
LTNFISACGEDRAWQLRLVSDLVREESPSTEPEPLERCGRLLADRCVEIGASVSRPSSAGGVAHVVAGWPGEGAPVLILGHFDTVWPTGQLAQMPLEEVDGKLYGPGVFDMKAGLAIALSAVKALVGAVPEGRRARVTLLATSDEEVGSPSSRQLIEDLARRHTAVLVAEPSLAGGALKTARKGVGEYKVAAHGVASHAGVDPGAGASAIHELVRQVAVIEALNDPGCGRSVNVGLIAGGSRPNVVAEHASAVVDVRIARRADAAMVEAAMAGLTSSNPRVRLEVTGGINRPPLERDAGVARLFGLASEVAAAAGYTLTEGSTGGASDGNFTAALGVPTLDGLGAVGEGPHALHEHIIVAELPRRSALMAGLIERLGSG